MCFRREDGRVRCTDREGGGVFWGYLQRPSQEETKQRGDSSVRRAAVASQPASLETRSSVAYDRLSSPLLCTRRQQRLCHLDWPQLP